MATHLQLNVGASQGRFTLQVRWETCQPLLGVFGHSGAGKTTLLESIAGLRRAVGSICVHGETWLDTEHGIDLPSRQRGVGYVPQDTLLFPHWSVTRNLLAGSSRAGRGRNAAPSLDRVVEVLELAECQATPVGDLSGGERQRVALGRAILSGAELLLLDEPLASLDLPLRRRILPFLLRVQAQFGLPTITVSHDVTEMKVLAREVLVLDRGRVLAAGPPESVFLDTAMLPMFQEDGFENVLQGSVAEAREAGLLLELEPGISVLAPRVDLPRGGKALVSLRADEVLLSLGRPDQISAQNIIPGRIKEIREKGVGGDGDHPVLVVVAMGSAGQAMVASITKQARARLALAPGMAVHLVFKAQSCRVLSTG
ncbi:MAG TPA: molybdenum ABC transporter ATP-binding protein [Candidatus Polarisedimenticolia bacterium]|nr:molybdenum ABC transporter ATP-binding protein [Candidatus Polarisedimenticolia bacterium]